MHKDTLKKSLDEILVASKFKSWPGALLAEVVKKLDTPTNKAILSKLHFTKKRASEAVRAAIQ